MNSLMRTLRTLYTDLSTPLNVSWLGMIAGFIMFAIIIRIW